MAALTPFRTRTPPQRVLLAGVVPLVFGVLVGLAADVSGIAYWALNVLAIIGALVAGAEMDSVRDGALRGLVAGVLFGLGILLGEALAAGGVAGGVPEPNPGTPVVTGLVSALLGAAGATRRPR